MEARFRARRSFLKSAAMFSLAPASAATNAVSKALQVKLLRYTDDSFEDILSSYYPGVLVSHSYPKWRDWLVILKHDGDLTAKGYAIEWVLQETNSGQIRKPLAHYMAKHRYKKARSRLLQPQQVRLLSPFFNTSPEEFERWHKHLHSHIPKGYPFLDAKVIGAALDSIIFADGSTAGPNSRHFLERFAAIRNAEHDEGISVERFLRDADQRSALAEHLHSHILRAGQVTGSSNDSVYTVARGQEAAIMLALLNKGGLSAVQDDARRRVRYGPTRLKA